MCSSNNSYGKEWPVAGEEPLPFVANGVRLVQPPETPRHDS